MQYCKDFSLIIIIKTLFSEGNSWSDEDDDKILINPTKTSTHVYNY